MTVLWIHSKYGWHKQLASSLHFTLQWRVDSDWEWLVHIVLLDCDTHPPHVLCCYFIYSITDVELPIHSWFLPDLASYIGTSPTSLESRVTVFRIGIPDIKVMEKNCKNYKYLEWIVEILVFWKKNGEISSFGYFFAASYLIVKYHDFNTCRINTNLKLCFNLNHVETMIQSFEKKYGILHNFYSNFKNTKKT